MERQTDRIDNCLKMKLSIGILKLIEKSNNCTFISDHEFNCNPFNKML